MCFRDYSGPGSYREGDVEIIMRLFLEIMLKSFP